MTRPLRAIRGSLLAPDPTEQRLAFYPDAIIRIDDDGRIAAVDIPDDNGDDHDSDGARSIPETWPGAVLMPGFVDVHLHFPQTRIVGSASGPLLPWLKTSVFPEELRFADRDYAAQVAVAFCDAMLTQGTTAAGIYSSSHEGATDALCAELDRRGLRAQVGLTLMNRGAPAALLHTTESALAAAEVLIDRWHRPDRLAFCVTPRFALACDETLLRGAAELAQRRALWIQTHLSENPDELAQTSAAFPDAADYLAVYESCGLVGERTILAHCIHLTDDEWDRIARRGAVVGHCPDSNFFLGSGCMDLRAALSRGIRVGLGSDVGAGRTFSIRRVAASAYDASLVRGAPTSPETLLWLATRGGALAMGMGDRSGCVAPGFDADLVAVDVPDLPAQRPASPPAQRPASPPAGLIDALLFRHDAGPVRATVTRGALRWSRAAIR